MVLTSLLQLHDVQMKFVTVYKKLVRSLYIYINVIHILSTGHQFIPPSQLNEMLAQVKKAVLKTTPDNDLVIKRIYFFLFEINYFWYR